MLRDLILILHVGKAGTLDMFKLINPPWLVMCPQLLREFSTTYAPVCSRSSSLASILFYDE